MILPYPPDGWLHWDRLPHTWQIRPVVAGWSVITKDNGSMIWGAVSPNDRDNPARVAMAFGKAMWCHDQSLCPDIEWT